MSRFRPAGFRNGRTAWRRASRRDSGRPGTVRWHRATDLPLPPTVKRRSARRPPPLARPCSEAQRAFVRPAAMRSTHREIRCSVLAYWKILWGGRRGRGNFVAAI